MRKRIIDKYYTALMVFLVFTFADHLLQGIIQKPSIELALYILLWITLTIQATYSYICIRGVKPENYSKKALLSDCLDIAVAVYVCAAISCVYVGDNSLGLKSFLHLSIPFFVLSINQFSWFAMVKDFNIPAIFRIVILFCGMTAVSISELICHGLWNLAFIVCLIVALGIMKPIDKAPKFFGKMATRIWIFVRRKLNYPQDA